MALRLAIDVEAEIDRLYGLPLGDFVRERNALAARVAKAGDREAGARVKALPKPSQSAWAVDALVRRERGALDALLRAGDRARAAQARALATGSADELRDRVGELRDALLEL